MKVLVTGCDGYIGSVLTPMLVAAGHQVIGLDTGYFRSGWMFHPHYNMISVLSKDIRDISAEDLAGYDAVVHLAEISNDPMGQTSPEATYSINQGGTLKLLDASQKAKIQRFVYFSSCSVYGESPTESTETSNVNPLTAYAECKVLNEQELMKRQDKHFVPVILRNATAFGASPRMRFDLVVNNLSGIAWTSSQIKMDSDGTPWRPFVHIADISQAALCALEAPADKVRGQIVNVGDNRQNYQIKQVAEIVAHVFPGCTTSFGQRGGDKRDYKVNFDKIHQLFPNFQCKYDVQKGAQELKNIFEFIGLDKDIFDARHYTRLKQIQYLQNTNQIDDLFGWNMISS